MTRPCSLLVAVLMVVACGDSGGSGGSGGSETASSTSGTKTASTGNSSTAISTTASSSVATTIGSSSTGAGADTWLSFANGFFTTYCHACHGPGDQLRDYSLLTEVMGESAKIRCGTAVTRPADCNGAPGPKQFPIGNGPKPSDAERDRLVAWIDAGLPE